MSTIPPVVLDRLKSRSGRRVAAVAVPAVVLGAVGVTAALVAPSSDAVPSLPHRSPAQLIAAVHDHAASTKLSGVVREVANFGLPSLPGQASPASLSWQTFLTGSHSARVWLDGAGKQRVALIGELSEADVTHNGRDVWTYTSSTNTVSHTVLPAREAGHDKLPDTAASPTSLATRFLKAIDPTTKVSVDTAQRVAGRPAYTLTLSPRDTRSTVREVRIAVDATKYVPLQLQVFGAGSKPAFQIGFTDVSFTKPADSAFTFRVPKGATVTTDPLGSRSDGRYGHHHHDGNHDGNHQRMPAGPAGRGTGAAAHPVTIGKGWTSVVEFPKGLGSTGAGGGLLDRLTTSVGSSGQRLLHTSLVNAVLLPDGRVFVGAVSPALLEHIAATTH